MGSAARRIERAAGPGAGAGVAPLVRRAQKGDSGALATLVERAYPTVARFCRRLVPEAAVAEDLAQETLLRAHRDLPRLATPARFEAWLCGIAANLARTWWRRRARAPLSLDDLDPAAAAREPALRVLRSPEHLALEAEAARRVYAAVGALPPAMGRAVVLFYQEGLSYAEVAAALDVPVSTVKSRLFESRVRLRLMLAPEDHRRHRHQRDRRGGREEDAVTIPLPAPLAPPVAATPFVRLQLEIDREALVDACHALVTATRPEGVAAHRAALRGAPLPLDLLEMMVLEGVSRRQDVARLVNGLLDGVVYTYRWEVKG